MERISFDDFLKGSASGKYNALPQVQETALNTYGERNALPVDYAAPETNATKPETKGVNREAYNNPSGSFTLGGANHKLVGGDWRVMNPDGTPMGSWSSYNWWIKHHEDAKKRAEAKRQAQKPGMSTGKGSFFDRFDRR